MLYKNCIKLWFDGNKFRGDWYKENNKGIKRLSVFVICVRFR